jgi:hypothetical protein
VDGSGDLLLAVAVEVEVEVEVEEEVEPPEGGSCRRSVLDGSFDQLSFNQRTKVGATTTPHVLPISCT